MRVSPEASRIPVRWFGPAPWSDQCVPTHRDDVPVGAACADGCGAAIAVGDEGVLIAVAVDLAEVERDGEDTFRIAWDVEWVAMHAACYRRALAGPCRAHGLVGCDGTGHGLN